jgi:nucleoside-diphosphate kinase
MPTTQQEQNVERTFVIIKPDGVQRGLVGEILKRYEQLGLRIAGLKFIQASRETAEAHYAEHKGKGFYEGLITYILSAPIVVAVVEGTSAVDVVRKVNGKTNPAEAECGSIRGDFALERGRNLVHGSDSQESAAREIALWFSENELITWSRVTDPFIFENA